MKKGRGEGGRDVMITTLRKRNQVFFDDQILVYPASNGFWSAVRYSRPRRIGAMFS